jgi:(1->4)-alpha-D-glucan 1-alpha-D-glucosylmutase
VREPISTYRVQFHKGFRFTDAHNLVPYLAQLGITEIYSSPQLKASPGSPHGYDICNHRELNDELGSRADYDAFTASLADHGMGQIVDIVPNHMGADSMANPWWRDVLENGPSSPFADYFDIEWDPIKPELRGKVLLPMLGDQYGRVLERGELRLLFGRGELTLQYFGVSLPINPGQTPRILGLDLARLQLEHEHDPAVREYLSTLTALQSLPAYTERDPARIIERQREKEVTRERLARLAGEAAHILEHIEQCVRRANGTPGDRSSFDDLHELLERQAYRLAYWRTAFHEINYRRFFDINELVALRMEHAEVFEATHTLVKELIARGQITGLRVDHPDGLFDPQVYFERLQNLAGDSGIFMVAEKILSHGESLPAGWPLAGTTGYTFLNQVSGLFIDPMAVKALRRMYRRFTGRSEGFDELAYECKRTILLTSMASELNLLAHALNRISERDRRCRDFTLESCRKVLLEVIACFNYYRTYVSARGVSEFDKKAVGAAVAEAARRNPLMEASIFSFLESILIPLLDTGDGAADDAQERLRFAMKFQQFTGPVHAKGVEDTAFYRYNVIVSANEVGGHPERLGVSIDRFHRMNLERLARSPLELLATTTHDAKRGEDARARLNAISEIPDHWRRGVSEWMRMNAGNRTKVGAVWAPDRNDEYLFYQALAGAWPAEPSDAPMPVRAPEDLQHRVGEYMQKAVREAKVHTSWVDENQAYGEAVRRFVERTLSGRMAYRFVASFIPIERRLAELGMINSLAQLALKLTSPGVADFYQGCELWNFDLVDPDNRRPVDYMRRLRLLDELQPLIDRAEEGAPVMPDLAHLVRHWYDGRIKMFVTACLLRFRRRHAELMLSGDYLPLAVEGPAADHLVGFARCRPSKALLCIVPRLTGRLSSWESTRIFLPPDVEAFRFRHLLTAERFDAQHEGKQRWLPATDVFGSSPIALLAADRN